MSLLTLIVIGAWLAANPTVPSPGGITVEREGQPIYGGDAVDPGEWPAVVGVYTGKLCTGTLVAPDLVLTAAHCLDPEPLGPVQIYFGHDLDSAGVMASNDWGRHPDFCLPADCGEDLSDFAWIRLPTPVDVEPILPLRDQAEFDQVMRVGGPLRFVGFGQDEDQVIGIKREVAATLTGFNASGREFEAGGDGNDTCNGDSGGPALAQLSTGEWRLAGVISRGGACGEGGIYGVPNPELCWLRDSSGVDLLAAGCDACDCITLNGDPPEDGCGCESTPGGWGAGGRWGGGGGWLAVELGLLFGVVALFGRSRRRRGTGLALGLALGLVACATESPDPSKDPAPKREPAPERAEPEPSRPSEPIPVEQTQVTITAAEATAAGLPALGFSLDTTGSGMSLTKLGGGQYLQGSGPPGGVLWLAITPTTIPTAPPVPEPGQRVEQVELLGAPRSAIAWIEGESMARSSYCAVTVGKPDAKPGDPALRIELAVSHSGDTVACATALDHHVLGPIVASLVLEP